MTDGTKSWANIRIEEPVRDEASDDPRTYTEIMRAGLDAPNPETDADEIAKTVVARLDGAKPLEDMAFDDWWEPDYAQTIALSVVDELEGVDIAWGAPDSVQLEASERRAIAEEVAEVLRE